MLLDLRGNGGGSTDGAMDAIGVFLPGVPLFPMKRRDGTLETDRAPEPPRAQRWTGPVATLVDAATASAAEMISGALSSYRRGPSVGETTYGKGCAQEYLNDDAHAGVLRLTTLLYALPDGTPVQRIGLAPTLRIPLVGKPVTDDDDREATLPHAPPTWRGPDVRPAAASSESYAPLAGRPRRCHRPVQGRRRVPRLARARRQRDEAGIEQGEVTSPHRRGRRSGRRAGHVERDDRVVHGHAEATTISPTTADSATTGRRRSSSDGAMISPSGARRPSFQRTARNGISAPPIDSASITSPIFTAPPLEKSTSTRSAIRSPTKPARESAARVAGSASVSRLTDRVNAFTSTFFPSPSMDRITTIDGAAANASMPRRQLRLGDGRARHADRVAGRVEHLVHAGIARGHPLHRDEVQPLGRRQR